MELDREDFDDLFEGNENEDAANASDNKGHTEEGSERVTVPVPKRIVKNPRLKFNPERLCGERGIPILVDHFKNVRFKGKGHEEEDLDKLLSTLELWTHRLFPSMKFEDCLNQIEKLGKKRPVQTCLRKIRLDMPILSSDFVKSDDDEDDVQRNDDPEPLPEDPFDRLIGESQDILNSNVSGTENFGDANSMLSSPMPSSTQGQVLGSSFGTSLTEEQKERMERNKLLAAERRKAKLEAMKLNTSNSQFNNLETSNFQNISVPNNSVQKADLSAVVKNSEPESEENTLMMETDHCSSEKEKIIAMDLDDQNSEHLGLDDLIDLVDEGESSKKSTVASPGEIRSHSNDVNEENIVKENEHSFENASKIIIPGSNTVGNTSKTDIIKSSDTLESANSELLGLESMLDLVEE